MILPLIVIDFHIHITYLLLPLRWLIPCYWHTYITSFLIDITITIKAIIANIIITPLLVITY